MSVRNNNNWSHSNCRCYTHVHQVVIAPLVQKYDILHHEDKSVLKRDNVGPFSNYPHVPLPLVYALVLTVWLAWLNTNPRQMTTMPWCHKIKLAKVAMPLSHIQETNQIGRGHHFAINTRNDRRASGVCLISKPHQEYVRYVRLPQAPPYSCFEFVSRSRDEMCWNEDFVPIDYSVLDIGF